MIRVIFADVLGLAGDNEKKIGKQTKIKLIVLWQLALLYIILLRLRRRWSCNCLTRAGRFLELFFLLMATHTYWYKFQSGKIIYLWNKDWTKAYWSLDTCQASLLRDNIKG